MKRLFSLLLLIYASVSILAQNNVDTRIAINEQSDPNTFVVIISNEHYKYEQPVPFALNDGKTFRLYCEKTLGIPAKNIRYTEDATLNDMRMQLQWLTKIMKAYDGEARALVYYSGHGMPSEDGKHAYLLPVDGNSTLAESGLSTTYFYKQLGQIPSRQTLVILDACFSGARRDGQMLSASRGVAIKSKSETVGGNLVVFSAAQGDETAYPYNEKQHGLFTYYLLEQLQQKGGCVSLGELTDYVTKQVRRKSILENNKDQTPSVISSANTKDWRNWTFAAKTAKRYETVANTQNITSVNNNLAEMPVVDNVSGKATSSTASSNTSIINIEMNEAITNQSNNENSESKRKGYRVQVFVGGNSRKDRLQAEQIGNDIKKHFANLPVYVHFYSPRWVCRVGNYPSFNEANKMLIQLRDLGYKEATIVKGKIIIQ